MWSASSSTTRFAVNVRPAPSVAASDRTRDPFSQPSSPVLSTVCAGHFRFSQSGSRSYSFWIRPTSSFASPLPLDNSSAVCIGKNRHFQRTYPQTSQLIPSWRAFRIRT
jgi:hypothetical protein